MMDESLTSLDPELKKQLMGDLRKIFDKLGAIVIYVTYDVEEANSMVDRIARLEDGRIRCSPC